jgi:hypothetical protein
MRASALTHEDKSRTKVDGQTMENVTPTAILPWSFCM